MAIEVKIPTIGESINEGTIARWLKKDGDVVREGDGLLELETDKATSELPAPAAGTLHIAAKEGQTVAVGSVVGTIDADRTASRPPPAPQEPPKPAEEAAAEERPKKAPTRDNEPDKAKEPPKKEREPRPAPAALKHEAVAEGDGRSKPDVSAEPPVQADGREKRQRMSAIRQRIAQRLVAAQHNAAILTTFNEADLSAVLALRAKYKELFQKEFGVGLGLLSFFVKAAVAALKAFPEANAFIDKDEIVYHDYYNIGVAVSTEKGLMVPVIRDADKLSFADIEKQIGELAQKARDGKVSVSDLQGGTFTITNGGVFGSLLSTPLLNPPQSAILGMHAIQKRPVAVDDQVVIRPMMYLALSYDHRLIDGREAVSFLMKVKELVEAPERLLLTV